MLEEIVRRLDCGNLPFRYGSTGQSPEEIFLAGLAVICDAHPNPDAFEGKIVESERTSFRYTAMGAATIGLAVPGDVVFADGPRGRDPVLPLRPEAATNVLVDAIDIWNSADRMVLVRLRNGKRKTFMIYASSQSFAVYLAMRHGL